MRFALLVLGSLLATTGVAAGGKGTTNARTEALLAEFQRYSGAKLVFTRGELPKGSYHDLMPELDAARRDGRFARPAWQEFRWDLEELRVSLFAQELGTRRQVSAKRLARQLELLA